MPQRALNTLKILTFILCFSTLSLVPGSGHAATFCLKIQGVLQPECIYDDAGECRARAAQINGLCTVNPDKMTITATNGQFCLITSGGAVLCSYLDRASCNKDALKQNGVCVDSTVAGAQPDLHRNMPGRLY